MDLSPLLANPVFTGALGAAAVGSAVYALKSVPGLAWEFATWRFTSELVVFNEDPAFEIVSDWLASISYAKKARKLRLTSDYSEEARTDIAKFSPGIGQHLIFYKGRPVVVSRYLPDKTGNGATWGKRREDIRIQTLGTTPSLMHELIAEIMAARAKSARTQTEVYMYRDYWKLACRKDKRSLGSVVMPRAQRDGIVDDIESFLSARSWYAQRGIPYRRGFLLYGPPGCGKTSLVMAIAGHFSKPIYALNLGSVNGDDQLIDAITSVPENAILLIEDIDAAQANRVAPPPIVTLGPGEKAAHQPITMSALLNSIDGAFSREGRILFMTTNHSDKIDPALLRPGRADRKELIGELGEAEARTMCAQFECPDLSVPTPVVPAELQRLLLAERNAA